MADERPFRVVDLLLGSADPHFLVLRRLNEPAVSCSEINWQKRVICQDDKSSEKLQCSCNNSNNCAVETGQVNFAVKLQGLYEFGMCFGPVWTSFGQGVPPAVVLEENAAKWRSVMLQSDRAEPRQEMQGSN